MFLYPYPWRSSGGGRTQLARAETVVWYPILLLACVGLIGFRRNARVLSFPFIVGAATASLWALVEGNFGTAYRHRGEFVWAVVVFAAAGLATLVTWGQGLRRGTSAEPGSVGIRLASSSLGET